MFPLSEMTLWSVSRVTWAFLSLCLTCCYRWRELNASSLIQCLTLSPQTSKTRNFVLLESFHCFGFSFNHPGWLQTSISSCRVHSVNTKYIIDHCHDYSTWNFLAGFFSCCTWTFLSTRHRRLPFDLIKALQIIHIFGTWVGLKRIPATTVSAVLEVTHTEYKYFHFIIKKKRRSRWDIRVQRFPGRFFSSGCHIHQEETIN